MSPRFKEDNDPVHGNIPFTEVMRGLMDMPSVTYLERRSQLGFVSQGYRSATNTRFSHVLGVAHVIRRMGLVDDVRLPEEQVRVLEAAAMLHDPHYPFSHPTEGGAPYRHEWFMQEALRTEGEVGKIDGAAVCATLRCLGIPPLLVADVLAGKHPLLSQFIDNKVIDADKIEYIPRDARIANLTVVEIERLINELCLSDGRIGVKEDGVTNAADLLVARMSSTERVYAHKHIHIAETMYQYALRRDDRIWSDPRAGAIALHGMSEEDVFPFLQQSEDAFVRDIGYRLGKGSDQWYYRVHKEGDSDTLPRLEALVDQRQEVENAFFEEELLCSFSLAEKAVMRNREALPCFPVIGGERVKNLVECNRIANGAYLHVPAASFCVYAKTDSDRDRRLARDLTDEFCNAA